MRRPAWLALLFVVLLALIAALEARSATAEARRLDSGVAAVGTVTGSGPGRSVTISYTNPVTDQVVAVPVPVWGSVLPEVGQEVAVDVSASDPEEVALAGERRPAAAELWWYVPVPVIFVVVWVVRAFTQRRTETLAAGTSTAFAMLGALTPPRRFGRRCELSLYPLDCPPAGLPVAAVAVLTTAGLPVGEMAFPLEVKGSPRPSGLLIARSGGRVLWPAGRALADARHPRPALAAEARVLREAAAPVVPVGTDLAPDGVHRAQGYLEVAALVVSAILVVGVATIGSARRAEVRELLDKGTPVVADVVATGPATVAVVYRDADGRSQETETAAGFPSAYVVGRRYPAHVRGGDFRFDREPYDLATPVVWAAVPAVVSGTVVGRRRWRRIWVRRVVSGGPFMEVEAVQVVGSTVDLRAPGESAPRCRVTLEGREGVGPSVVAAGAVEPRGRVALHDGATWRLAIGRAVCPPSPDPGARVPRWVWSRAWLRRRSV